MALSPRLLAFGLAIAGATLIAATAAEAKARNCTPTEVAVLGNRFHVKCAVIKDQAYTGDIPYYAMNLPGRGNAAKARAMLDLLIAAKANNRKLRIWFDQADYKSVPGCLGSDCRVLTGAAMR